MPQTPQGTKSYTGGGLSSKRSKSSVSFNGGRAKGKGNSMTGFVSPVAAPAPKGATGNMHNGFQTNVSGK